MHKFAAIILALAALVFAEKCEIGSTDLCYYESHNGDVVQIYTYGGPQEEIDSLLKSPCEGSRIGSFKTMIGKADGDIMFEVVCPEKELEIALLSNGKMLFEYGGDRYRNVEYKGKRAQKAYTRATRAAQAIRDAADAYNWNP